MRISLLVALFALVATCFCKPALTDTDGKQLEVLVDKLLAKLEDDDLQARDVGEEESFENEEVEEEDEREIAGAGEDFDAEVYENVDEREENLEDDMVDDGLFDERELQEDMNEDDAYGQLRGYNDNTYEQRELQDEVYEEVDEEMGEYGAGYERGLQDDMYGEVDNQVGDNAYERELGEDMFEERGWQQWEDDGDVDGEIDERQLQGDMLDLEDDDIEEIEEEVGLEARGYLDMNNGGYEDSDEEDEELY